MPLHNDAQYILHVTPNSVNKFDIYLASTLVIITQFNLDVRHLDFQLRKQNVVLNCSTFA